MMRILEQLRHPEDEKFIQYHLGGISEIELRNGSRLFRLGRQEFDSLSEAAAIILSGLREDLISLGHRKTDEPFYTQRTKAQKREMVNAALAQIEQEFSQCFRSVLSREGPFNEILHSHSPYHMDEHEGKAFADLSNRLVEAVNSKFLFLLIVKNLREILNLTIETLPEGTTVEEVQKENEEMIIRSKKMLQSKIDEAMKLLK